MVIEATTVEEEEIGVVEAEEAVEVADGQGVYEQSVDQPSSNMLSWPGALIYCGQRLLGAYSKAPKEGGYHLVKRTGSWQCEQRLQGSASGYILARVIQIV